MHQVLLGRHDGTSGLDCIFLSYLFVTSESFAFHALFYCMANGIHACTTSSKASASGLLLAGNPFLIAVVFSVCSSSAFPPDQTCLARKSMPRASGAMRRNITFLNIPLPPIAARTAARSRRLVCVRGGDPTGYFLLCGVHVACVSKNKIRFVSNRCMGCACQVDGIGAFRPFLSSCYNNPCEPLRTAMPVIAEVIQASKEFISGDSVIVALKPSSMELSTGKVTLIIGPSGSGKTTLLSLIGCVIYPTSGEVIIDGIRTSGLSARKMAGIRLNKIGFIFQQFNLLAPLTAEQNVMLPLTLQGIPDAEAKGRVRKVLEQVNMSHRAKSLPKMMSGGEQQRIAIARALVTDAPVMLCDEPTASLDTQSAHIVMEELKNQAACGKAVAIVTHDMRLKPYADEIVYVENGQISKTEINEPI